MSEKIDSRPFRVDRNIAALESPLTQRSQGVAKDWERLLLAKTAPVLQQPEQLRSPGTGNERTPTAIKWLRMLWLRRWGTRHKVERVRNEIHETGTDMTAFMTMAQYAINMAVQSEPLVEMQTAKRRELMDRWRNTYARVFRRNRGGL